jgi:hypothetical protein
MRKLIVTLTVAGLAVAFGATPGVAGGGNVNQFCKTWLAVRAEDGGPTERQVNRLRDTAPSLEIIDSIETAVSLFEELGEDAFGDPTFVTAFGEVDAAVIENCDYEQIDVSMQDYAFSGVPDEVEKGKVAFTLTNEGTELHEFALYRLKGDNTLDDVLELPADASEDEFLELVTPVKGVVGGFAFPGGADTAFVNLKKTGDYIAICLIPVGTTPEAAESESEGPPGPPHAAEGMASEFEVT